MSIFRWFSALDGTLANSDEPLDSELLFKIRTHLNALYEGIMDKGLTDSQEVKGHDHTKSPVSPYYGGAGLNKNQVYIASKGGQASNGVFHGTVTTASTWYPADQGYAANYQRSSVPYPLAIAYCSPDWDTGGAGVPSAANYPFLTGLCRVRWTPVAHPSTLSIRVNSIDLGRSGYTNVLNSLTSDTEEIQWLPLTRIPCQSGWNEFDIEVTSSNNNQDFDIDPFVLFEEEIYSPDSGGSYKLGVFK